MVYRQSLNKSLGMPEWHKQRQLNVFYIKMMHHIDDDNFSVRSVNTTSTDYTGHTYRNTLPLIAANTNETIRELLLENQLLKYQLENQSLKLENQFLKNEIQLLKQQIVDKHDIKTEFKQTSTVSESESESESELKSKPEPEPCKETSIPETSSECSQIPISKESKAFSTSQTIKDIPKNKRVPFIGIEEKAIFKGVNKYGEGHWTKILSEFKTELSTVKKRTAEDIRVKWRNMKEKEIVCEINGKWYIDATKY